MTILALLIGLLFGGVIFYFYSKRKQKNHVQNESIVLLESVRKAFKVISVEGDFTDIQNFTDEKSMFFDIFTVKKQALIVIKATAYIGYDMTKVSVDVDTQNRTLHIANIPEPEIINIETDIDFYDIKESKFHKLSPQEYTKILADAKLNIAEKVYKSKLIGLAKNQGIEMIDLIKIMAKSSNYNVLIDNTPIAKIENTTKNIETT